MNKVFLIAALLWTPLGGSQSLQVQNQNGVITGRLLKDGKPAAGIRVTAMAIPEAGVRPSDMAAFAGLVQTDSNGRYRLENIPPGRYFITAGFLDVPTYYPGVTSVAEARGIGVASGATVTDIDFSPAGPSGVTVRGRVIYPPGQAVPSNGQAQLGTGPRGITPALLNADGSFEFSKVRPGTYPLRVLPASTPGSAATIVVGEADVSGIEVKSPFSVTGKLAIEGGGSMPRGALSFTADNGGKATSAFQPDGTFAAQLVEGNYSLAVSGIPGAYAVRSITAGAVDLMANPLRLSMASAAEPLTVTLRVIAPTFKINGKVAGPGFAQARAPYQLALESDSLMAPVNFGVRADGSFEVPQVLPGDYKLRVTAPVLPIPAVSLRVIDKDPAVVVTVPRTMEVSGRVMVEGQPGQGPQPGRMIVTPMLLNGMPASDKRGPALTFRLTDVAGSVQSIATEPGDDGTFRVVLPEGEFRLVLEVSDHPVRTFTYGPADLLTNPAFKVETATDTARFDVLLGQSTRSYGGFRIVQQAVTGVIVPPPGAPGVAPSSLPTTVYIGPDIAKADLLTPQSLPGGSQEVTLRVSIDRDGRVTNSSFMSGNPQLTNAAVEAVQQWRYRPHLVNGQPAPVVTTVNVNFP